MRYQWWRQPRYSQPGAPGAGQASKFDAAAAAAAAAKRVTGPGIGSLAAGLDNTHCADTSVGAVAKENAKRLLQHLSTLPQQCKLIELTKMHEWMQLCVRVLRRGLTGLTMMPERLQLQTADVVVAVLSSDEQTYYLAVVVEGCSGISGATMIVQ